MSNNVSRRTFIQGSATAGVVVSGAGAILANTEEAWALSTEVLSGDTALSILIMARTLYPHDFLGDQYYAEVVANLDEQAKTDSSLVEKLDNGFETIVEENGRNFSVGQKQRIGVARALFRDPSILILDEATSALDSKTEKLVLDSIDEYFKNNTKIIIAHRLTTIRNSDKIVVMSKGKIIEQGKHSNLIKNKGLYYEMWNKQKEIKKQVI